MSTASKAVRVVTKSHRLDSEPLLETIKRLFAVSPEQLASESESERRISSVVREFLSTTEINTSIDPGMLAETFNDSIIPDDPCEVDSYLNRIAENVVAHSTRTSSPRFVGHMTSSLPYFVRTLSKLLVAMNQNVVKVETAKALSPYERQVIAMIHRLVYRQPAAFYDEHIQCHQSTLGIHVSGGTIANVSASGARATTRSGRQELFTG